MIESDIWEKEEDLENAKELVDKFKEKLNTEVRRQEKKEYKRSKLLGKYMTKLLYGWDDRKFEEEYLKKLEKNWCRWKLVSLKKKP